MKSSITPGHVRAFQYVRTPLYENVTLVDCTINGEPGAAIVMVEQAGNYHMAVMPLFVAITDRMKVDFPNYRKRSQGGDGGPTREGFELNKEMTQPTLG